MNEAKVQAALGKRGLNGEWIVKPSSYRSEERKEFAKVASSGIQKVFIRLKPELAATEPQHNARLVCMSEYLKIKSEGYLDVVIDRVQRPREAFYSTQILRFEFGKEYEVPFSVAAIALQHEPYCFLFEVCLDRTKVETKPDTSADDFAILLAEIKALRNKVTALETAKDDEVKEPEVKVDTKQSEVKRPAKP